MVLGTIIYLLFMYLFNTIMWLVFKCEALGNHDYSFLLDDSTNNHMIVGVGIFEKFDFISMKAYMLEKCTLVNKCQSKLVKKLGLFWF